MSTFRDRVEAALSLEDAKTVFLDAFTEASAAGTLPAFRSACASCVLDPPTRFCLPYAFAYEARALMHDWTLWHPPQPGERTVPRPELLAGLDACLARPEAINHRDNYYWSIIAGLRHTIAGDAVTGFQHLADAARHGDFYRVVKDDLGCGAAFARSYPTEAELDRAGASARFARDADWVTEFSAPQQLVISTAFDRIYGQAFAEPWIRSVVPLAAAGVGLHFHVMFRNAADSALLQGFAEAARAHGVDLAISVETQVAHANAYFASARFLKAAHLLRHFDAPMLFADADSFMPSPEAFRDRHLPGLIAESRVMGLIVDGPWNGYLPWRRFSATWMFSPNRPDAAAFLTRVADAIEYFWDERGCNWWIDQMALEIGRCSVTAAMAAPPSFGDVFAEFPGMLDSGEQYKLARIAALPQIRSRMEGGMPYWQALDQAGRE